MFESESLLSFLTGGVLLLDLLLEEVVSPIVRFTLFCPSGLLGLLLLLLLSRLLLLMLLSSLDFMPSPVGRIRFMMGFGRKRVNCMHMHADREVAIPVR